MSTRQFRLQIQAMREQYQSMTAEQQQQRRKVVERWAAEEHKKTESLSRRMIAQMITIAEAEIDFKEVWAERKSGESRSSVFFYNRCYLFTIE